MPIGAVLRLARELTRVIQVLPQVEAGRRTEGPASLIGSLREQGRSKSVRTPERRADLQRAIRFVDRWMPDGGNCYRRSLLEIALDPQAAQAPLHLALRQHGGPKSGHAWLGDDGALSAQYDAEFVR
jgi:Transglutaminase-like superfamily